MEFVWRMFPDLWRWNPHKTPHLFQSTSIQWRCKLWRCCQGGEAVRNKCVSSGWQLGSVEHIRPLFDNMWRWKSDQNSSLQQPSPSQWWSFLSWICYPVKEVWYQVLRSERQLGNLGNVRGMFSNMWRRQPNEKSFLQQPPCFTWWCCLCWIRSRCEELRRLTVSCEWELGHLDSVWTVFSVVWWWCDVEETFLQQSSTQ